MTKSFRKTSSNKYKAYVVRIELPSKRKALRPIDCYGDKKTNFTNWDHVRMESWIMCWGTLDEAPCWCCEERPVYYDGGFEGGHVVPRKHGGKDVKENVRPICMRCNRRMGAQEFFEYKFATFPHTKGSVISMREEDLQKKFACDDEKALIRDKDLFDEENY